MGKEETGALLQKRTPDSIKEFLSHLRKVGLHLPPAELKIVEHQGAVLLGEQVDYQGDGIVEVAYRGGKQQYVYDLKLRGAPQVLRNAIAHAQNFAAKTNLLPMIVAPYLSGDALKSLANANISGVDLSGNGVIIAPDFTVWRTGFPNLYPEAHIVRNLYRGASSLIVRCFLLRSEFSSLTELHEYALSHLATSTLPWTHDAKLTMGTTSKVVQEMIEQRLIEREKHHLRVVNPRELMDGLRINRRPPHNPHLIGQTTLSPEEIWRRMAGQRTNTSEWRYTATGLSSASHYQVLSGIDTLSFYVSDLESAADLIGLRATRVFPNVELIEDRSDAVYFDARGDQEGVWASPIQTWLELAAEGPREREAAENLASALAAGRGEWIR